MTTAVLPAGTPGPATPPPTAPSSARTSPCRSSAPSPASSPATPTSRSWWTAPRTPGTCSTPPPTPSTSTTSPPASSAWSLADAGRLSRRLQRLRLHGPRAPLPARCALPAHRRGRRGTRAALPRPGDDRGRHHARRAARRVLHVRPAPRRRPAAAAAQAGQPRPGARTRRHQRPARAADPQPRTLRQPHPHPAEPRRGHRPAALLPHLRGVRGRRRHELGWSDIVAMPCLPDDVPRVAGFLNTAPITPLSHTNVLASGWGIPNAIVRDLDRIVETARPRRRAGSATGCRTTRSPSCRWPTRPPLQAPGLAPAADPAGAAAAGGRTGTVPAPAAPRRPGPLRHQGGQPRASCTTYSTAAPPTSPPSTGSRGRRARTCTATSPRASASRTRPPVNCAGAAADVRGPHGRRTRRASPCPSRSSTAS